MQSTISNDYKKILFSQLKDKEYRIAFMESHINNGIPFQIRTMRNNRKMKQEDLGKITGMKQEAICRLENPNYGSFTLKTLKEIANAFDVALMVKFVPFSELVKFDLNLSSGSLDLASYDEDHYFKTNEEKIFGLGELQRYTLPDAQEASADVISLENYKISKNTPIFIPEQTLTAVSG